MVRPGLFVSRTLACVLALSLSLGSVQCFAGGHDAPESSAPCCGTGDAATNALDFDLSTGAGDMPSPCSGACPVTGLQSPGSTVVNDGRDLLLDRPEARLAGRTSAPDPLPPRAFIPA